MRKVIALTVGLVSLAALGAALWVWNIRATVVFVDSELPPDFPERGFSHESFERSLRKHVDAGNVDYDAWHADAAARADLDRYLAAIAAYSPDSAPERFSRDSDALAYWIYAYNAFVIKAILDRWPLESVTDVKAPVEIIRGLGFFYTLEFIAGGERFTLYRLEHDKVIAPSRDPRVHFVLNCGSGGCPIMRPELPTGDALEPFLAKAARDFVSEERNVRIDHERRRIYLSQIFEWYEKDFIAASGSVLRYVTSIAPKPLADELKRAADYNVVFIEYDWSVNDTP